jgi:gluconate 2-dehydrogenase gamma chain
MAKNVSRRKFLRQAAAGAAASAAIAPVVNATAGVAVQASPAQASQQASAPPVKEGYTFLNANEAAFIEAFVDLIVPADELTPSGTDLGLAAFIDRQLAGAWGKGERFYRQGPWKEGSPGQGYQLPLTPAEFFRAGISAVNKHCKELDGKEFDRLAAPDKEKVIEDLVSGKISLGEISGPQFFDLAYQATMEGMFGDPIYGGNRNKAAWKMIGYPGVIAVHATNIETYRNKPYVVNPVSITDLM